MIKIVIIHSVLLSDNAEKNQQGEVMGVRWSLRMLGDALLCIFGGILVALSVSLPMMLSIFAAIISLIIFYNKFWRQRTVFTHLDQGRIL